MNDNNAAIRRKGYFLTILGVLWMSPDALLLRLIDSHALEIIGWRAGLTALVLLMYLYWRDGRALFAKMLAQGSGLLIVTALYSINSVSFVSSIVYAGVADALVIIASTPLWAALFSYLILREILSVRTALAIFLGAVGVFITASGGLNGGSALGMAFALATSISLAIQFTLLRKWEIVDPVAGIFLGSIVTCCIAFAFSDPMSIQGEARFWAIILGLFLSPIAFTLVSIGPKYIPSAEVSLIMFLETLLGPLWVWMALGEEPSRTALIGGAIILLGVGITTISAFQGKTA